MSFVFRLCAVAAVLAACGAALASVPAGDPVTGATPYDRAYWSRPHNAYEAASFPRLVDVLDRGNRVVEIDVWDDTKSVAGDFSVSHDLGDAHTDNNCAGGSGGYLSDCLNDVLAWSQAHPGHWPITIQLDLKAGLGWGWESADRRKLEDMVDGLLGGVVYTPADLRAHTGYASLREGVAAVGWPTLDSLRGRIVVVMTGGPIGDKNDTQEDYIAQIGGDEAAMFVCPEAHEPAHFAAAGNANDFDDPRYNQWVVCGNKEATKYWSAVVEAAHASRQLVNLWASDATRFDAFHQAYLAVAWGAAYVSRETTDDNRGLIPLNGVRRSVPAEFSLESESSGLCLDASGGYGDGSDIIQWPCHGGGNQRWVYSDETQLRVAGDTAYCFDVDGGDADPGSALHLWDCDGGDSEHWRLTPEGALVGIGGLCAALPEDSTQAGAQGRLRACTGSAAQRLRVVDAPGDGHVDWY